jgi:hypothetical protein
MSNVYKVLKPGLRPNDFLRRLYMGLAVGKSCLALFCVAVGAMGASPLLYVGPIFLASVPVYVWALFRYPAALVLEDGIELAGRFVPYTAIKGVENPASQCIRIAYNYHGVNLKADLAFSWLGSTDVFQLTAELRQASGLTPEIETRAATVSVAT